MVGGFQALSHSNDDNSLFNIQPGFQTPAGNLNFNYLLDDDIVIYFDVYLTNRTHNPYVTMNQGYAVVRSLPDAISNDRLDRLFEYVDIKAGSFMVNFGDQLFRRSDNADVQRNPLVGNYVIDPAGIETAAEVYFDFGLVDAMVGFGSGMSRGQVQQSFTEGRGFSYYGKLSLNLLDERFRLTGSYYQTDQSATGAFRGGEVSGYDGDLDEFDTIPRTFSRLFLNSRTSNRYLGVLNGGANAGDIMPLGGQDMYAFQIDARLKLDPVTIYGLYGRTEDSNYTGSDPNILDPSMDDVDRSPTESWDWFGVELVYDITDQFWLAGRYSVAMADVFRNVASDGQVDRIQAGVGFRLLDNVIAKVEYVHQSYSGFNQVDNYNFTGGLDPLDLSQNPSFNGLVMEVSFGF